MKISCPACAAKYSIADEKVQDRLAKIRCRKCGTTIVIDGKVSPPLVTASSGGESVAEQQPIPQPTQVGMGAVGPAAGEYSVDLGDHDQRTMNVSQLRAAFGQGSVTGDTFVWAEGMADWQRIADVPDLFNQLSPTGASRAVPADPFTTPRASIATKERSSAADLFGGIESAGSEEDVTTSAPEPAPLAPKPEAPAATGARNESSVLFSLSALTGAPGGGSSGGGMARAAAAPAAPLPAAAPRRSATASNRDDSGLIDLKALSTAVNTPGGNDAFGGGMSPLGLAPPALGMSPLGMPLGGMGLGGGMNAVPAADDLDIARGRSSKGPMFIGAAILVVGLAAVAVFAMKSEDPATDPAASTLAVGNSPTPTAKPVTPEPAPAAKVAEKADEPTAAPPTTGTATPPAAPASKTASASRPTSTKRPSSPQPVAAAPAPAPAKPAAEAPAPAPVKKAKCNCKPTDLLCAMKCSSKK